jgi:hypothetical protein
MALCLLVACNKSDSPATTAPRYMYVASGACYGGGVTTSTGSSTIVAYNLNTGQETALIADYNSFSPGDNPVAIAAYDPSHILVTIENASGRRVDVVSLTALNSITTYLTNSTALSGVLRAMELLSDGSLLISKSSAIEKFSSGKSRVLQGANPYINAPGGSCATSTTLISSLQTLSNGKILYAHAGATPNNKIGLISATGYSTAADC